MLEIKKYINAGIRRTIKWSNNVSIKEAKSSELTWLLISPSNGLGLVCFILLGRASLTWLHCGLLLHTDAWLRPQMASASPLVGTMEPQLAPHVSFYYQVALSYCQLRQLPGYCPSRVCPESQGLRLEIPTFLAPSEASCPQGAGVEIDRSCTQLTPKWLPLATCSPTEPMPRASSSYSSWPHGSLGPVRAGLVAWYLRKLKQVMHNICQMAHLGLKLGDMEYWMNSSIGW